MQKNIFDKLQLTQTAIDDERAIVLHRAAGYVSVEGKPGELRNAGIPAAGNGGGGFSVHSTVSDLLHWHQSLKMIALLQTVCCAVFIDRNRCFDHSLHSRIAQIRFNITAREADWLDYGPICGDRKVDGALCK
jgi:hypothetical protein